MKKLLLLLMLIVATLSARAQVVYFTLDHQGMVQKKTSDGKIYFAITGKVHNMKALGLEVDIFHIFAEAGNSWLAAPITVSEEKDTTFELKVPTSIGLNTEIVIKCRAINGSQDFSAKAKVKAGFKNEFTITKIERGTDKQYTYTCQYKLQADGLVKEDGSKDDTYSTPKAMNPLSLDYKMTFSPLPNDGILADESYDGRKYNKSISSLTAEEPITLSEDNITYNEDGTFSWKTTAIAGSIQADNNMSEDQVIEGNEPDLSAFNKTFPAYTINLTVEDNATDNTKKEIHAEVTDFFGNKVTSGKINYARGYYNTNTYGWYHRSHTISEKEVKFFNLPGNGDDQKTGYTFKDCISNNVYKSTDLTNGAADIDYNPDNWESNLNYNLYVWYSPSGDASDNGSLFYAIHGDIKSDFVPMSKKDKYTLEMAEGTSIKKVTGEYGNPQYEVTLQLKKDGEAVDWPEKFSDISLKYYLDYEYSSSSPIDVSSLTDVEGEGKTGQKVLKIKNVWGKPKNLYLYSIITAPYTDTLSVYSYPIEYKSYCTSENYTSYLGDHTNGTNFTDARQDDDLTGLLAKTWDNATETTTGKDWTTQTSRKHFHVSGNTTVSQTIAKASLHPASSTFNSTDTYTLQAIVRSTQGAHITLTLTHGKDDSDNDVKASKTVLGLGMEESTHSTVNKYGRVDTLYTILNDEQLVGMGIKKKDIPYGGWQKIEATVGSGSDAAALDISITSDNVFDLSDVVLLKNANTTTGFQTTIDENENSESSNFDLSNCNKFSFFDRGPRINRIVKMERNTCWNYETADGEDHYQPFNILLAHTNEKSREGESSDQPGTIKRFYLTDSESYFNPSNDGYDYADYISYDRTFKANQPSTLAVPFDVPVSRIFDYCTKGGYDAVKDLHEWHPTPSDENWGILHHVSDNGDVILGLLWDYTDDGKIGGKCRIPQGNNNYTGPIMYIKTVKDGQPFMCMHSDETNGGLAVYPLNSSYSSEAISDYNVKNNTWAAKDMEYTPVNADGSNTEEFQNFGLSPATPTASQQYFSHFFASTYGIEDITTVRNTEQVGTGCYDADYNEIYATYECFYYWSAKDGSFHKALTNKVKCPPYRAILAVAKKVGDSEETSAKLGISFIDFYNNASTTTGIQTVTSPSARQQSNNNNVYSVTGTLVRRGATSLNGLPNGLYIVNGKKVIVNHK